MSTPPRRRRPAAKEPTSGSGWLPTVAMGLGVIVAGLGIGALIAVFMQRGSGGQIAAPSPVALTTSTPSAAQTFTRPPLTIATLAPPRATPRSPTPAPSPSPTDTPAPTDEPSPTDQPTPTPPAPTSAPSAVPTRSASAAPRTTAVAAAPVATRTAVDTPEPTEPPTPTTAPSAASATPVPDAYAEHASTVVRRYIDALIHGDDKTAYAALGGSGTLSEQTFLDPSARIVSLKVTRIDASNASVGAEIDSAKGHYYATYHVTASTSGPYISEHDFIKV